MHHGILFDRRLGTTAFGRNFNLLWLCRLSLTSITEAQVLGESARGLLAISREEAIAHVAGFFLEDIRNLKGKVDVFCFSFFSSNRRGQIFISQNSP